MVLHSNQIKLLVKDNYPIVVCLIAIIGGALSTCYVAICSYLHQKWEKMAGNPYSSFYINTYLLSE